MIHRHQVNPGELYTKAVSFFCDYCENRNYDQCINSEYTNIKQIKMVNKNNNDKEEPTREAVVIVDSKKERKTTNKKRHKIVKKCSNKNDEYTNRNNATHSRPKHAKSFENYEEKTIRKMEKTGDSNTRGRKKMQANANGEKQYFSLKLKELQKCVEFDNMLPLCTQLYDEFNMITIKVDDTTSIVSCNLVVDKDASIILPKTKIQGTQFVNYFPVVVFSLPTN